MKNKYFPILMAFLIVAILIVPLAGCSSSTTTSAAPPAATTSITTTATATATALATQTATATTTKTATPTTTAAAPVTLNISAAASLTDAIKEINTLYVKDHPNVVLTPNFASSGTLQTQIENGAPVDVFISAAAAQMDNLQKKNLIDNATRRDLLNNKVVLIVPLDSKLNLSSFTDLTSDKVSKIAIGDPKSVPAGSYANKAFELLNITSQVQSKFVLASDVRQVLTYVESGNVDAGIVYSTDALISNKIKIAGSAPDAINAQIVYPAALIKASTKKTECQAYLDFLFSSAAKTVFEKYGFSPVK